MMRVSRGYTGSVGVYPICCKGEISYSKRSLALEYPEYIEPLKVNLGKLAPFETATPFSALATFRSALFISGNICSALLKILEALESC